jgi:hypothetical protein
MPHISGILTHASIKLCTLPSKGGLSTVLILKLQLQAFLKITEVKQDAISLNSEKHPFSYLIYSGLTAHTHLTFKPEM